MAATLSGRPPRTVQTILGLQRLAGNAAVCALLAGGSTPARESPGRRQKTRLLLHSFSCITPADGIYVQRVIGNHMVPDVLLARQKAAGTDAPVTMVGPLTPAQVRDAIAFYTGRPGRYTRDIIMQIQMEMGTTPTGHMSAVDVQAVAKRQEALNVPDEPKLKVDGKAGPRTLPSVFKFGLSEDQSVGDYTKEARTRWDNKGDKKEEDVARGIVDQVINKRLGALGIPPVVFEIVNDLGLRGAFNSADWKLKLDPLQFKPGKFHDLRETTVTMYHEARHAEQDFCIGQLLAQHGKDANEINAKIGLRADVAQQAIDHKNDLTPMQALIAQGWFDSEFSDAGLAQRQRNSDELKAAFKAREAACEAFKKNPTPKNKEKLDKAKERFSRAVSQHDDLPHEFDAERLGAKVKKLFGQGEDHDDPC